MCSVHGIMGVLSSKDDSCNALLVILVAHAFPGECIHQASEIFMPLFVLFKDQKTWPLRITCVFFFAPSLDKQQGMLIINIMRILYDKSTSMQNSLGT